jgi:uncharacterized sulfatase
MHLNNAMITLPAKRRLAGTHVQPAGLRPFFHEIPLPINLKRENCMIQVIRSLVLGLTLAIMNLAVAEAASPNLVVFISDDHGFLDSSVAGASEFNTPNLERLASAGMQLSHAFSTSPSCAPSRASLLTGLMPMRSGSMLNHEPPRRNVKKLPAYLRELGYEVVAFGKVAHYNQGKDYGFDLVSHDDFHNDACVSAATEFLSRRTSTKPLCFLVGTNWPHVPWPEAARNYSRTSGNTSDKTREFVPPASHIDTPETRAWRARYAAAVERYDADLGRLYDAAYEELGPNTLFLHFSDHGAQWPFAKWNCYDAGTRVACIAVWPGVIHPASNSDALISLVDVLPTLVDAAGGKPPTNIDGQSFADVLTGETTGHRDRIFTTHSGDGRMNAYPMRSVRTRQWKYIRNLQPDAQHATHIDLGKKIDGNGYWRSWLEKAKADPAAAAVIRRYHHRPAEELYNVQNDPHELRNLADQPAHSSTVRDLRASLNAFMHEQHDNGVATEKSLQRESGSR